MKPATATQDGSYIVMGRIGAAWGVKGWVKLHSFTDPQENLLEYRHFYITGRGLRSGAVKAAAVNEAAALIEAAALEQIEIDASRPHGQGLVGHIVGCDSREATERFKGCELLIDKAALPSLDDSYYWHELEGLRVSNLAGECFGIVDHLIETGANDVLVVKADAGSIDSEERLIPYVPEQVIIDIDLEQGTVTVDWDKDF